MHSFNLKYYSFIQLMFRMYQYDLGDFFTIVAKDSKVLISIQLLSEHYLEHWELLGTVQLVSQRIIRVTWKRKQLQSYSKVPYKDRNLMMEAEGFPKGCRRTWIKLSSLFSPVAIEQRKNAEWRKLKVFKVCTQLLSLTAPSTLFCLSLTSCWMS